VPGEQQSERAGVTRLRGPHQLGVPRRPAHRKIGHATTIPIFHSERSLASALTRLHSSGPDRLKAFQAVDWDKAFTWLRARTGADLAPEQAEAVNLPLTRKVAVLIGPGCSAMSAGSCRLPVD
jgi:hypothetical protein